MKQRENRPRWVRLDNAAKIYPAARRKNWSNLFRLSVTLTQEVDVQTLQSALDVTVKRFPTIAARLRKGVFWYYLQQVEQAPKIQPEYSYPLVFMSKEEMRKCAFRVIAYQDRIAVEFFHSLTDGTGAMIFLKTLTAEYLQQKYAVRIPPCEGVLDRTELPSEEETEDCFPKNAGSVAASRADTNAWHMYGEPNKDGFLNLTCFTVPTVSALETAHRYHVTLTVLMSAAMMQALYNLQAEKNPITRRPKPIKVLIPINLRALFPSKTLRNFAMYITPQIDPRLGAYSFEEICEVVHHKMGLQVTPKYMRSVIATNVNDERNPLVRLIPLPLKNAVMKAIFDSVGEKKSCLTLSNLGKITVPTEMQPYVRRFDFILGAQAAAPYNCGMLSYADTLYINFVRDTREAELERHFFRVLQSLGLPVCVQSNRNWEEVEKCTV